MSGIVTNGVEPRTTAGITTQGAGSDRWSKVAACAIVAACTVGALIYVFPPSLGSAAAASLPPAVEPPAAPSVVPPMPSVDPAVSPRGEASMDEASSHVRQRDGSRPVPEGEARRVAARPEGALAPRREPDSYEASRRTTLLWDDWFATRIVVDESARTLGIDRVLLSGDFVAIEGSGSFWREIIPDREIDGVIEIDRTYVIGGHEVVVRLALGGPSEDVVNRRGTGMVTLSLSFDGELRARGHLSDSAADHLGKWTFSQLIVDIPTHTLTVTAKEGGGAYHLVSTTIGNLRTRDSWIIWASDFAEDAAESAAREAEEEAEELGERRDAEATSLPTGTAL